MEDIKRASDGTPLSSLWPAFEGHMSLVAKNHPHWDAEQLAAEADLWCERNGIAKQDRFAVPQSAVPASDESPESAEGLSLDQLDEDDQPDEG